MGTMLRVFLLLLSLSSITAPAFSLYEDQAGLADWHQKYIGKVKDAVFHTQKTGRKRVVVSTEENVIASLDLRHGEIFWRHVLGANDILDGIDIAMGKYVITLSSKGSILRAWNLPDGQMVWESYLEGPYCSKSSLLVPTSLRVDQDNVVLAFGKGRLHAVSSIHGEILWKKDIGAESFEIQHMIQDPDSKVIHLIGFVGSSQCDVYTIDAKSGELLKHETAAIPGGFSGKASLVSSNTLAVMDSAGSTVTTINFKNGEMTFNRTPVTTLIEDFAGVAMLLPLKLEGIFALKTDWNTDLLEGNIKMDQDRGSVQKVFINNYIRTDKSHGFRALIVMEDHSLLLLQQGAIVWSREDALASIVDENI